MMEFIYIMKEKDRDILIKHGYELIRHDELNHLWIFEDKKPHEDLAPMIGDRYVLSNMISL